MSRCKADWLREHTAAKETAVRAALTAEHQEWQVRLEKTVEEKLQAGASMKCPQVHGSHRTLKSVN